MVDAEVVLRRVREIGRRLGLLRELYAGGRAAFLADEGVRAQVERHLQVSLQAVIGIALHIVAADTDETAEDYGSAFGILADLGVIQTELADHLRQAAGLRNLLVHAYIAVDPSRVWEHLERLADLDAFAAAALAHVGR